MNVAFSSNNTTRRIETTTCSVFLHAQTAIFADELFHGCIRAWDGSEICFRAYEKNYGTIAPPGIYAKIEACAVIGWSPPTRCTADALRVRGWSAVEKGTRAQAEHGLAAPYDTQNRGVTRALRFATRGFSTAVVVRVDTMRGAAHAQPAQAHRKYFPVEEIEDPRFTRRSANEERDVDGELLERREFLVPFDAHFMRLYKQKH